MIGPDIPAPVPLFIHPPEYPPDSKGPEFQSFWKARRARAEAVVAPQRTLPNHRSLKVSHLPRKPSPRRTTRWPPNPIPNFPAISTMTFSSDLPQRRRLNASETTPAGHLNATAIADHRDARIDARGAIIYDAVKRLLERRLA